MTALGTDPASGQARMPRLELLGPGDLGGEPKVPALAGGVWGREPLILGVEPDLDRTVLYRLAWLARGPIVPVPAATPDGGQGALQAEAPELADLLEGAHTATGGSRADVAPAGGRPIPPDAAPSLPEIVPFPPLPSGVEEVAVAGSGPESLVAWSAREGPPEAPAYRLAARRFTHDGGRSGPDVTLQVGPGRPADLSLALATDGEALAAWTNHLPGRGAGLRWRTVSPDGELGPLRSGWDIASDQGSPSVAALAGGFGLAYLKTPLEGQQPGEAATDDATAPRGPDRELLMQRVALADGAARGDAIPVASRPGLDHPVMLGRPSALHVFWTDPRAGGRMLRARAVGPDGQPFGAETALRTDLRPPERVPYRIAEAGEGQWLVVWPQLEGRGRAMVLQARLYQSSGNAAGPPLLLGRSPGEVVLRDVVESRGGDRWIAVWTEEEAGRYRLRYRPMRLKAGG